MHIVYSNNKTKRVFSDFDLMKRKIPGDWVRTIKKHLDRLEAADTFGVFLMLGLGKPEALSGYDTPTYSLRVSANARFIVMLEAASADDVKDCTELIVKGVCDYHGGKENWFIP